MNQALDQAAEDAKVEISKKIDEFKAKIEAGTSDADNFMTMSDIEKEWAALRNSTDRMYSEMISTCLSNIDEKEIIKRKK